MSLIPGETLILDQQKEELEVLENIYLREMDIVKSTPPYKISIELRPYLDQYFAKELEKLTIKVQIELSGSYPYEYPKFQFQPQFSEITENNIVEMEILVQKIMEKHKDSPMIFEIVETIREWMQNNIVNKDQLKNEEIYSDEEEKTEVKTRAHFTPLTKENFLEWKKKFDLEHKKDLVSNEFTQRLTGRAMFEKNKALEANEEDEDGEDISEENENN